MSIPGSRLGIPSAPGTRKHRRLEGMPVNAVVGTLGTASFTWGGVPQDEIWTGAVSVPLAVPSSVLPILWSATDGGTPIGQWYNSQSSGPLQVNTQLQVTGSGITPATLVATLQGIATDIASAPPWWPAPTPAPPPSGPVTLVDTTNPAIGGISVGAGNGIPLPGLTDVPVLVGTSIEVLLFQATPQSTRLQLRWGNRPANPQSTFTFDVPTSPAIIQGLVLPNLGPFLSVAVSTNIASTIFITLVTGLPPIVRAPGIPQGMLIGVNLAAAVVGDTTIVIPPYVGPALLSLLLNATTSNANFYAHITHTDYLGTDLGSTWVNPQASADTGRLANVDPIILPIPVNLPPVINKLVITNSTGAPARIYANLIPGGP